MAEKEVILTEMLNAVPPTYDKRAGSFIYDALAPAAERFEKTDQSIDVVKQKLDIENLSGDELAQRIFERTGIKRKAATHSIGRVALTGTGVIRIGDLFETSGGVQFRATETKSISTNGTINVEAVIAGASGNVPANTITLFPVTLAGFTAVTNPTSTIDGFDAESDADLLRRYYERIRTPATSGNKAHYKNWAKEVPGVGDARIIPLWNGDNTVKVVIIDSDKKPASPAVVKAVQDYIDPGGTGKGDGEAPIGARTTVVSASGIEINISATVSASPGYSMQQVKENITTSLTQYFKEIAFVETIVSYAKVGATILDSDGVADYSNLLVNDTSTNISIGEEEVAFLEAVTIIE